MNMHRRKSWSIKDTSTRQHSLFSVAWDFNAFIEIWHQRSWISAGVKSASWKQNKYYSYFHLLGM